MQRSFFLHFNGFIKTDFIIKAGFFNIRINQEKLGQTRKGNNFPETAGIRPSPLPLQIIF